MLLYTLFLAAIPLVLALVRPRAITVILATAAVTWFASAYGLSLLETDDVGALILYIFVMLPMVTVAVAMLVGTTLAPRPRMWFDAGFLAMAGWWLGFLVLFFGGNSSITSAHGIPFSDCMLFIAAPAIYAGAGAGFGATNKRIA